MRVLAHRAARKRNASVQKRNLTFLGWDTCPNCGAPVAVRQRVLGGVGRLCRRCCWFMLERGDGRVEEGGGQFYTWLSGRLGRKIGHSPRALKLTP